MIIYQLKHFKLHFIWKSLNLRENIKLKTAYIYTPKVSGFPPNRSKLSLFAMKYLNAQTHKIIIWQCTIYKHN